MGFLRTAILCCAGFRHYREVRDLSLGASIKYLFQLVTVLGLLLTVSFIPWGWQLANRAANWTDHHVPPLEIKGGKVVSPVTQPYRAGNNEFLFLLDTTGQTTAADPQAMRGILLTSDTLIFWLKADSRPDSPVYAQRHSLRAYPDAIINGDYVRSMILAAMVVSLPLLWLGGILTAFAQALFFSLASSILEQGTPNGLRWSQLFNIALHAITPAAVILTTYTAMRLEGLDLRLIYIVVYGIFLLGATHACRNPLPQEEPADNE